MLHDNTISQKAIHFCLPYFKGKQEKCSIDWFGDITQTFQVKYVNKSHVSLNAQFLGILCSNKSIKSIVIKPIYNHFVMLLYM